MKSKLVFFIFLAIGVSNCKHENHDQKAVAPIQETVSAVPTADTTGNASATYVCPMHDDIKGKAGDVCSKCNMALVAESSLKKDDHSGHGHEGHNH